MKCRVTVYQSTTLRVSIIQRLMLCDKSFKNNSSVNEHGTFKHISVVERMVCALWYLLIMIVLVF